MTRDLVIFLLGVILGVILHRAVVLRGFIALIREGTIRVPDSWRE